MTENEINKRLDEMYRAEKSKKFLTHLIKSYFPTNKVEKVFDKPVGKFRCAITNTPLISVNEAYEIATTKEYFDSMMSHIKSGFSENQKEIEHPSVEAFGNRKIGVTSKDTDTFISIPIYPIFYNWLAKKVLSGDKNINGIINSMKSNMFPNKEKSENKKGNDTAKKEDAIKPKEKIKKPTFGDLDVLKELKVKMEKNG